MAELVLYGSIASMKNQEYYEYNNTEMIVKDYNRCTLQCYEVT